VLTVQVYLQQHGAGEGGKEDAGPGWLARAGLGRGFVLAVQPVRFRYTFSNKKQGGGAW
jgi:hypothetical protein